MLLAAECSNILEVLIARHQLRPRCDAQVPFAAAAARARQAHQRQAAPLLAGERVHIIEDKAGKGAGGGNGAVLRRVAAALGAKVGQVVVCGAYVHY